MFINIVFKTDIKNTIQHKNNNKTQNLNENNKKVELNCSNNNLLYFYIQSVRKMQKLQEEKVSKIRRDGNN